MAFTISGELDLLKHRLDSIIEDIDALQEQSYIKADENLLVMMHADLNCLSGHLLKLKLLQENDTEDEDDVRQEQAGKVDGPA